jgi:hypothetical protein
VCPSSRNAEVSRHSPPTDIAAWLGWLIDTRSHGGYVVAPGSFVDLSYGSARCRFGSAHERVGRSNRATSIAHSIFGAGTPESR